VIRILNQTANGQSILEGKGEVAAFRGEAVGILDANSVRGAAPGSMGKADIAIHRLPCRPEYVVDCSGVDHSSAERTALVKTALALCSSCNLILGAYSERG
jgi:hypothetical protein